MKRSTLFALATALSLLGLADALYLADMAYTGAALTCNITGLDGCNIVAQSAYSRFLGQPLAAYGVLFYGFFLLCLLVLSQKKFRYGTLFLAVLGTIGLIFSAYFVYIQLILIQALCIYCLGSALVAFLLWGLMGWQFWVELKAPHEDPLPSY